jgi:hypothetical protein
LVVKSQGGHRRADGQMGVFSVPSVFLLFTELLLRRLRARGGDSVGETPALPEKLNSYNCSCRFPLDLDGGGDEGLAPSS